MDNKVGEPRHTLFPNSGSKLSSHLSDDLSLNFWSEKVVGNERKGSSTETGWTAGAGVDPGSSTVSVYRENPG